VVSRDAAAVPAGSGSRRNTSRASSRFHGVWSVLSATTQPQPSKRLGLFFGPRCVVQESANAPCVARWPGQDLNLHYPVG